VNSLLENHQIRLTLSQLDSAEKKVCWELLGCDKVFCPAHGKRDADCWMIPRTHCTNIIEDDFFQKLATCLTCSFFKNEGEHYFKNASYFIADQIQRYNVKALERIYQKEESFVEILNRIPDGLFTTDQEWRITFFNPAAERITGFSADDAVGMYCKDVFKNTICESDCALKRAVTIGGTVHNLEFEFTNIDGRKVPIICSTTAFQDNKGRITGGIEIFKDITHRKQNEEVIKERNRELSILNKVAVGLNNTMSLDQILRMVLKYVLRVLRVERGALFLTDRGTKSVNLQVRNDLPSPASGKINPVIFKDELLEQHLIRNASLVTPNRTFPCFSVSYRSENGSKVPWLSCFLITFKGKGVGFLGLDIPTSRELSLHEYHLLGSLGNFLGGAIENARLMKTVQEHRQDLRRLTEKLFQSQEDERRRIARELHDEAGQSLTAVKLGLDRLEERHAAGDDPLRHEIDEIRRMIKRTSSEIRGLSYRLHPTLLIDLGLEPALNLYFADIRRHSGLDVDFTMVGFDHRPDVDIETVLYRFSQETLTNALKHSGAENFRLSIIKSYPRIIFLADDDGVGFDTRIIGKDQQSLGLLGMRERASLLGGTFQLRSKPGDGTRIRIEVPYSEEAKV